MNALAPIPADELAWAVECALAGDTAEDLAEGSGRPAAEWAALLGGQGVRLRMPLEKYQLSDRDRIIAERWLEGVTLAKIGDEIGFSYEWVRKLAKRLIARGVITARLTPFPNLSDEQRAAIKARMRAGYLAGERQYLPERNAAVEALIAAGKSYPQAGAPFGISRLAVAGIVYRDRRRRGVRS